MASSGSKSNNTGLKIIGGLLGLGLFLALFSDGDPDNDAWAQGEAEADDADGADDVDEVPAGDPEDPWTAGPDYGDDEPGPEPPACDGVGWFAADGGAVLLPVAGSGTDVPTPSCQLDDTTAGGDDDAVALVQRVLATCNGQPVVVDGAYGPETRQAVSAVQAAQDIAVDGIYGPQTSAVMAWPVEDPAGEVVGEDPLADRPVCTEDTSAATAADPDALPHTP
jgi:zinc D-Ala-D-Ala carboxypeptidase